MHQVTLVGYGNQGKAWAANLQDSGWEISLSGRTGGAWEQAARAQSFRSVAAERLRDAEGVIALLLPDDVIPSFFQQYLAGGKNRSFVFAHGFAGTFGKLPVSPSDDLILVAPKGIGQKLRENYLAGSGVMGVLGVEQDGTGKAWAIADSLAEGLGLKRVGVIRSTFAEETKADLLSEQVILCGAVPRLVKDSVEFLVSKGVAPDLARYECLNELKLIVDMMVEHGVDGMLERVSSAAYLGGKRAADVIVPKAELRARTEKLWQEIESGAFAEAFFAAKKENSANRNATTMTREEQQR